MRTWTAATLATITVLLAGCTGGTGETGVSPSDAPAVPDPAGVATLADLAARAGHTATALDDGGLLVAGGCVTDGCSIAAADTAVVGRDGLTVEPGPQMSDPRVTHTATPLSDGRVVIIGGFLGEGAGVTSTIDVFDHAAGEIRSGGALQTARGGHAAVPLDSGDGSILVIGGWVGPHEYTETVEVVDVAGDSTSAGPSLPWAADALEAVLLDDGRVLVTGGQVAPGVGTDGAAVFDPASATWTIVGPMSTARFKHVAVGLDDGRVLVIGGTTDDRTLLDSTEVFDPQTMTFSAGPRMAEPRYKLPGGAVALSDARVLVGAGGRSVEILDVRLGTSRTVAQLGNLVSFATVSLLADDRALILGGYDDDIDLTREVLVVDTE